MHLIIISGAPAVGKLTVARLVAERTGYRLFHNHLSIDLVESLFPKGSDAHSRSLRRIRLLLIAEAAKAKVPGVLFTIAYQAQRHRAFVRQLTAITTRHGGRVSFVALTCSRAELLRRVTRADRRPYRKITSAKHLASILDSDDYTPPARRPAVETIDTTALTPERVADRIVRRFCTY